MLDTNILLEVFYDSQYVPWLCVCRMFDGLMYHNHNHNQTKLIPYTKLLSKKTFSDTAISFYFLKTICNHYSHSHTFTIQTFSFNMLIDSDTMCPSICW
jgi:hypothetical protein